MSAKPDFSLVLEVQSKPMVIIKGGVGGGGGEGFKEMKVNFALIGSANFLQLGQK